MLAKLGSVEYGLLSAKERLLVLKALCSAVSSTAHMEHAIDGMLARQTKATTQKNKDLASVRSEERTLKAQIADLQKKVASDLVSYGIVKASSGARGSSATTSAATAKPDETSAAIAAQVRSRLFQNGVCRLVLQRDDIIAAMKTTVGMRLITSMRAKNLDGMEMLDFNRCRPDAS